VGFAANKLKWLVPAIVLIALLLLPFGDPGPNLVRLLFSTAIWIVCSVAWNLLGGFTGQVSFGFAVFYGLGAYTAALLINQGRSPYFAFLCSGAVAALASFLVGLPAFRLRGPYFVIATIGISETTRVVMNNIDITGGASGLRIMEKAQYRQLEHYYSAIIMVALAVGISAWIAHSKFGLALRAIKQDQDAAADLGVNPYYSKLWIHAIAGALTGMAGGFYARYHAFIYPGDVFAFSTGISILLMPVIGGIGTVWGPVLGGMIFGMVEEALTVRFPNTHLLLYGLLLILIILFEPGGLVGLLQRLALFVRSRRRSENPGSNGTDETLRRRSGA